MGLGHTMPTIRGPQWAEARSLQQGSMLQTDRAEMVVVKVGGEGVDHGCGCVPLDLPQY